MKQDPRTRVRLIISLISLGLISSMLISWNLWTSTRSFPHIPVFSFTPPLPDPFDKLPFLTLLALLVYVAWQPKRSLFLAIIGLMIVLALQDQMRWQPWYYQYFLMLLPMAFVDFRKDANAQKAIIGLSQLTLIAIYLWGGIHKCHPGFLSVYNESLIKPITDAIETPILKNSMLAAGYLIPPIEILIGLGLAIHRTRKLALFGAIGTHVIILLLLGPAKGYVSNIVVWPWNIVMIGMVIALFSNNAKIGLISFLRIPKLRYTGCVICILLFVTPILFYAEKWDRYLSFNLYSGRQKRVLVKIPEASVDRLPIELKSYYQETKSPDGHKILSLSSWSLQELRVPLISEWRVIRFLSKSVCDHNSSDEPLLFYIEHQHLSNKPARFFNCQEIEGMRPVRNR